MMRENLINPYPTTQRIMKINQSVFLYVVIIGLLIHLETLFVLPLLILVLLTQMINFHIFMTITVQLNVHLKHLFPMQFLQSYLNVYLNVLQMLLSYIIRNYVLIHVKHINKFHIIISVMMNVLMDIYMKLISLIIHVSPIQVQYQQKI